MSCTDALLWYFNAGVCVCVCAGVSVLYCIIICVCVSPLPRWLCSEVGASEICCQRWILIRDHCHIYSMQTHTHRDTSSIFTHTHLHFHMVQLQIHTGAGCPPCWCFVASQVTAATLITRPFVPPEDWHPVGDFTRAWTVASLNTLQLEQAFTVQNNSTVEPINRRLVRRLS